jgi:hypothetical protein
MDTIRLPTEFKEFLELLNSEKVEYVLVGGYAVILHGYSRATGDLDIWVRISQENARALTKALRRFGFSETAFDESLFQKENQVVRIGHPPLRIDLLTSVSGLDFADAYAKHTVLVNEGVPVRLISIAHLEENKLAAGRLKDRHDVEQLKKASFRNDS